MVIDYLGIYGVCLKENKVLCIKKARGPYKNRFDLPGGSQKTSEGFTETLVREFLEETGYKVSSYDNCRVYDIFVEEKEAYPKDLKLNKVHMRTHRHSGLLISNKLCGGDSTKSISSKSRFLSHSLLNYIVFNLILIL